MICGNCNQWTSKVTITENGKEQCENCSDGGLHLEPAWMRHKPTPRWESHPNEYKKIPQADGSVFMQPTDESLADLEAMVLKPADEDVQAREAALAEKRDRPSRIEGAELAAVLDRANRMVAPAVEEWNRQAAENEQEWQDIAEQFKVQ